MHDEADMVSAVFDRDACRGLSGGGGGRRRSSGGRDRRFCRWMSCARDAGCLLDGYFLQGVVKGTVKQVTEGRSFNTKPGDNVVQNGSSKPEREPGNSSNKRSGKVEDNGHKDGGPEDLRTRKDLRMEAPKHPTSTL
nr:uncharacterized protein LOC127295221 [Lolium perenne]